MELPLWLGDPAWAGMHSTDVGRAVAAGLRFRPLAETLAGAATAPAVEGVGLTPEREAELLAAWHGIRTRCRRRARRCQRGSSRRITVRVGAARVGEVERQELEADDVDHRVARRHERDVAAELPQRRGRLGGPRGGAALALEHEAADALVDRGQMPVEELLERVRLGRDEDALAQLQHGLLGGRPVAAGARDQEALVLGDG